MVEEVFEGFFRVIGRLITQVIIEFVFEILIKGPGYFITKQFTVEKPEIDSATVVFVGTVLLYNTAIKVFNCC